MGNNAFVCSQVMADSVGLPCRLVRGSSYCGKEDDAMVVVKCGDERYASSSLYYIILYCLFYNF